MSCQTACYEALVESCNDIVVRANFPPDFPLYWLLSKPGSSNLYQRLTSTDENGDLTISKDALPAGYLINGEFYNIQVRNGDDYMQPVTFIFGSAQHSCILARLMNINRAEDDDSEVNVIEFKESVVPGGGPVPDNSTVWPFVNQSSLTINHNLGREVDVTIYDLSGNLIIATVTDDLVNHNYVVITFTSPTSGRVLIQ